MTKFLTPLLLIAIAIAVFVMIIDPTLGRVKAAQLEQVEYDDLLSKTNELKRVRDRLLDQYNAIPTENKERLKKMLPDNVDNIKLLIEIDSIASRYGMVVRNVTLPGTDSQESVGVNNETIADQVSDMGTIELKFSVASTYANFLAFIKDLEKSLRLVDIQSISFKTGETDFNEYSVTIKTYWLKSSTNY